MPRLRRLFATALSASLFAAVPAYAQDCDRSCLEGFMDDFLEALLAHDPGGLPLATDMRYTEARTSHWATASGRPIRSIPVTGSTSQIRRQGSWPTSV